MRDMCVWVAYGVVSLQRQKRGKPEVLREAVLMGKHRHLRLPLYAAATRFGT